MKAKEERMSEVISRLEDIILDVISEAGGTYISQRDIATRLDVYDSWDKSHWLVATILNKLQVDDIIEPKIRVCHGGRQQRVGWRLTESAQKKRTVEGRSPTISLEIDANFAEGVEIVQAFIDPDEANQVLESLKSTILSELGFNSLEK